MFNDADIEMAQLAGSANDAARVSGKGVAYDPELHAGLLYDACYYAQWNMLSVFETVTAMCGDEGIDRATLGNAEWDSAQAALREIARAERDERMMGK